MAVLGSFGQVVFEVSRQRARSFEGFGSEAGARLDTAEILGREPVTEFLGPDAESVSFTVRLLAELGVDPETEYDALHAMCSAGTAAALVLGSRPYGGSGARWIIEKLSAAYTAWDGAGHARAIDVTVSLRKYVQVAA